MVGELTPEGVLAALAGEARWNVRVVAETGSTNADVLAAVRAGTTRAWEVLLARHQTSARGRLDRTWTAAADAALALSATVPLADDEATWGVVPLAAGLATVRALDDVGVTAGLKWPNDVIVGDRKLAGILVEAVPPLAVVGIGVNLTQTARTIAYDSAVSLAMLGRVVDPSQLVGRLLHHLAEAIIRPDLMAYSAACVTLGRRVRVYDTDTRWYEGLAVGVAPGGELLVEVPGGGCRAVVAGDVYHLREAV